MLALSVASYGLALRSPVYTDEIGWKLVQGHFVDDGLASRSTHLAPSCGSDTFSTPAPLIPIRYVNSLITDSLSRPSDIRLYGLFMFFVWTGTTWLLLRTLLASDVHSEHVIVGIVSTVTLGVMPLIMVISRPEQVMLIGMSVFLILAVDESHAQQQRRLLRDVSLAFCTVIGSALVLGSHPGALLILPVILLACARVIRRRAISLAAGAIVTVFAAVAFADFNARLACPDDATIRYKLVSESIGLAVANHRLGEYFQQLASLLFKKPGAFFFLTQFGFNDVYVSGMIPAYPYRIAGLVLTVLLAEFIGALALTGILAFTLSAVSRIRKRRGGLLPLAALASAWVFPGASLILRATRNNYEAELIQPVLVLVSVLSLWFARDELSSLLGRPRLVHYARIGFFGLIALSIVSQIALLVGYGPIAEGSWSRAGYPSRQPVSVSTNGFLNVHDRILAAAARCNIRPGSGTQRLVVDELTYFAFRHTKTPYLMTYLYPASWGRGISDLPKLLARKHSSGVIVGCQWIIPEFTTVVQTEGFCCVPEFGNADSGQ